MDNTEIRAVEVTSDSNGSNIIESAPNGDTTIQGFSSDRGILPVENDDNSQPMNHNIKSQLGPVYLRHDNRQPSQVPHRNVPIYANMVIQGGVPVNIVPNDPHQRMQQIVYANQSVHVVRNNQMNSPMQTIVRPTQVIQPTRGTNMVLIQQPNQYNQQFIQQPIHLVQSPGVHTIRQAPPPPQSYVIINGSQQQYYPQARPIAVHNLPPGSIPIEHLSSVHQVQRFPPPDVYSSPTAGQSMPGQNSIHNDDVLNSPNSAPKEKPKFVIKDKNGNVFSWKGSKNDDSVLTDSLVKSNDNIVEPTNDVNSVIMHIDSRDNALPSFTDDKQQSSTKQTENVNGGGSNNDSNDSNDKNDSNNSNDKNDSNNSNDTNDCNNSHDACRDNADMLKSISIKVIDAVNGNEINSDSSFISESNINSTIIPNDCENVNNDPAVEISFQEDSTESKITLKKRNGKIIWTRSDFLKLRPSSLPLRPQGFDMYKNLVIVGQKSLVNQSNIGYWNLHNQAKSKTGSKDSKGNKGGDDEWVKVKPPEKKGGKNKHAEPPRKVKVPVDEVEELKLQVMSILNKITPQTFDKLVVQLKQIPIKNATLLDKLVSLVFEKAIQEPNFCNMYADMCVELQNQSKFWPFLQIVHNLDTNQYFWMTDLDFNNELAGPYPTEVACIYGCKEKHEMKFVDLPVQVEKLVISENNLIKIFVSNVSGTTEYFASYSTFNSNNKTSYEIHTVEKGIFPDRDKAENHATKKNSFQYMLVFKYCQKEFLNAVDNDGIGHQALQELKKKYEEDEKSGQCSTEVKAFREQEIEEKQMMLKKRMQGTIRFIGELYKKNFIKATIMYQCISTLLCEHEDFRTEDMLLPPFKVNNDEQDLELLCGLLKTVGQNLDYLTGKESKQFSNHMDAYFSQLGRLTKDKRLNSRIRFNIEEVINMRKDGWKNRRQQEGPLKIDEIHQKMKEEELKKLSNKYLGGKNASSLNSRGYSNPSQSGTPLYRTTSREQNKADGQSPKILVNEFRRTSNESKNSQKNSNIKLLKDVKSPSTDKSMSKPNIVTARESTDEIIQMQPVESDEDLFERERQASITDSKLSNLLHSIIDEFLADDNMEESLKIKEVNESLKNLRYCERAIPQLIITIFTKYVNSTKVIIQDKLIQLIYILAREDHLSGDTVKFGIEVALNAWEPLITLWDYITDCAKAPIYIEKLLETLLDLGIIKINVIVNLIDNVKANSRDNEYIDMTYLEETYSKLMKNLVSLCD